MRGLVAMVTIMTLMIVVGLGLFAYGVATKIAPEKVKEHPAIVLPLGSKINQVSGYKSGLALYVTTKGTEHIYLVSPSSGKITGHIPVTTAVPEAPKP